ncbi:MAG: hypothetical protein C0405_11255 [Desulfovibrio sp.]|nr:hypothetical protein [Desulfovibrio sp.]
MSITMSLLEVPMGRALFILTLVLAAAAMLAAPQAQAGRRVALVMGNSAYKSVTPLANPANDARLMAEALKSQGFELVGGRALTDMQTKADMEQAVQRFGEMVRGAAVGVFFYAGHGVQVDGRNYLVPVSANVSARTQIKYQLMDADFVLDEMAAAGTQVNVVVLDACRNNPFGDRGLREVSSGLAQIMAPKGTLVAYSTAPGRTAADGRGANSPFTAALARHIKTPGLRIDDVFMRVGAEVEQQTGGEQSPWKSDNLRGVFCLSGECGAAQTGAHPAASSPANDARIAALERELAEQAKAARLATQAGQPPQGAGQSQYLRPEDASALGWDASWRLGSVRNREGARAEATLDEKVKAEGSQRSCRVDFSFPQETGDFFAGAQSRLRRDLSGFSGVEFAIIGSRAYTGRVTINTSSLANPSQVDRFYGTFSFGGSWQVVRVPFGSLALSRGWARKGAALHGFTPGDGVVRLSRVEELRIGVDPSANPPGQGSFWVDSIRFYK